jgi:hypothetical protein
MTSWPRTASEACLEFDQGYEHRDDDYEGEANKDDLLRQSALLRVIFGFLVWFCGSVYLETPWGIVIILGKVTSDGNQADADQLIICVNG